MAKTYEIPTANGLQTVEGADSKQAAITASQQSGQTVTLNKPAIITPPVITPESLKRVEPYKLPKVEPTASTGNLSQVNNAAVGAITATIQPPQDVNANSDRQKLQDYLGQILGNNAGQAEAISQVQKEEDLAGKREKATALKNDLDQFDKEYRDEVARIKENPQGKFGSAIQQDLVRAQERYENIRANKVLSYNSAAGDYNNAREVVNEKVAAFKDQNAQAIQAYQLLSNSIMNDLTESEKLKIQQNIKDKETKAKTLEDAYASALQAGLDNTATQSYYNSLDRAKEKGDVASIMSVISSYGYKTLDQRRKESDLVNTQVVKLDNGSTILINTQTGEVIKNIGGGKSSGPTAVAGLTPEQQKDPFIAKMASTAGGKPITDTFAQSLNKGLNVLGQIGVLQTNIKDVKTGPIVGAFKGANPWDTNAQTIKAQLNAIVPNLARGVYGEVGVLTDNDIAQYSKTLPNLKSTEDIRNAVLGITVDMVGKSIKRTLEVNAANGKDVSGFIDLYTEMQNTRDSIFQQIPGYGEKTQSSQFTIKLNNGKDLNLATFEIK